MRRAALEACARAFGLGWELRRRAHAAGMLRTVAVQSRVVSIGNLAVGGTGKTTLTLHLAARARAAGRETAVVCRNYRPGPAGLGDEPLLYRQALGEGAVFAGDSKREEAERAAAAGARLILVDDGFSHWALERDLDLVLLDARDPWAGGALLPAGGLREPRRALQRAEIVVLTRLAAGEDPAAGIAAVRPFAPAAAFAAGRHEIVGARDAAGGPLAAGSRVRVLTATGRPEAVAESAREAGLEVTSLGAYRDHHWFTMDELRSEVARAERERATLLLTEKDAVRWPAGWSAPRAVLSVRWAWVLGGEAVERRVLGEDA